MKKTDIAIGAFAIMVILSGMGGIAGIASAEGGTYYVGTNSTNDAVTYTNVSDALNNAGENATIVLAPGTYNGSWEVTDKNVTFENYNVTNGDGTGANVEFNATNADYGQAFYGIESNTVNFGTNVTVSESAVYANVTSAPSGATTYANISEAVGNVGNNTVIYVGSGNYSNVSYNITSENLAFDNFNSSESVTIDSSNTTEGSAFYGEYADTVRVGPDITIIGEVYAGGSGMGDFSSMLTKTFMGIPYWAIGIVLVLGGYVVMQKEE